MIVNSETCLIRGRYRRRPLEFEVRNRVFLRVSPTKGIIRYGMIGKFSPRYIGPQPIVQWVREVVYRLELPPEIPIVHNVFYVSQLRKHVPDPSHVMTPDPIQLWEDLSYEEQPVQIPDWREDQLRRKIVPLVKVLWANHVSEAA